MLSKQSRLALRTAKGIFPAISFVKDESKTDTPNSQVVPSGQYNTFHAILNSLFIEQNAGSFIYFHSEEGLNKISVWLEGEELKISTVEKGKVKVHSKEGERMFLASEVRGILDDLLKQTRDTGDARCFFISEDILQKFQKEKGL